MTRLKSVEATDHLHQRTSQTGETSLAEGAEELRDYAKLEAQLADTQARLNAALDELERSRHELVAHQRELHALANVLSERENYLREIRDSRAWKLVGRYWNAKRATSKITTGLARELKKSFRRTPDQGPEAPPPSGPLASIKLSPAPTHAELLVSLRDTPAKLSRARPDVVCFSLIDWDFRYQRPQQMMSQFAAHGHRVFYIRLDRVLTDANGPAFWLREIKQNLFEITMRAARHQWVNQQIITGDDVEAWLAAFDQMRRELNINDVIGYVQIPSWTNVALAAQQRWGWRIVYDCMDEWRDFPGLGKTIPSVEPRLVQNCDLLVVTAQRLYEKWSKFQRPMELARNAVDLDFYDSRLQPNDLLADCTHPIVGYFGAIAEWFDVQLMAHVARACPGYTFVLLGGVFDVDVSALEALPNVRLLGQQPYELMPQYLYHFDACVIPFKINSITEATDPVKLYEYLSAGKPVVSVNLPELQESGEHVYIAESRDDFVQKLHAAINHANPESSKQRRAFAEANTWSRRYESIINKLVDLTPLTSIVVVTHNNVAHSRLCLESVLLNTEYLNYEIVVVDNNSTDETRAYLQELAASQSNVRLVLNSENVGFARANNQGIAVSRGEYLVLLNNDTAVPRGWLTRLLSHLKDESVGMAGPVTNSVGNEARIEVSYSNFAEMEQFAAKQVWEHDGSVADIGMLAMFCVAMKRSTYEHVGPLDERFGIGMFEDDDYTHRMKALGYRVVCAPDVFVHHFGQATFKKLIELGTYDRLFSENRRRFETKWNVRWIPHQHGELKIRPRLAASANSQNGGSGSK